MYKEKNYIRFVSGILDLNLVFFQNLIKLYIWRHICLLYCGICHFSLFGLITILDFRGFFMNNQRSFLSLSNPFIYIDQRRLVQATDYNKRQLHVDLKNCSSQIEIGFDTSELTRQIFIRERYSFLISSILVVQSDSVFAD